MEKLTRQDKLYLDRNTMIEARELRIGNYAYPFDDINLVENKTIIRDSIKVCYKDFKNTNNLEPIPLTEEWLLKFGFEPSNFKKGCYFLSGRLLVPKEGYYFDYGSSVNLKHVHQLQNFYFALTEEELELKES